jgi:hypothetical protein
MVSILIFVCGPKRPEERRPLAGQAEFVNAATAQVATQQQSLRWSRNELEGRSSMRAVIFIIIIAVLVVLAGLGTGYIDINQIRGAQAPQIAATHNGVTAKGGQAPAFEVETGSVKVGTQQKTVNMPTLEVQKPAGNEAVPVTNNAM